jgi:predicted transposase/invertase (TIGR01784 family)
MNVEMSVNPDNFEPVRLEFHTGKLFTGQDIRGIQKTYNDLNDAYQIAFLVKGRFFEDAGFLHTFEYYDELRRAPLGGRTHIITVELAKLGYLLEKPVNEMSASERWAFYFRYITDREKRDKINEIIEFEEGIEMASEVLMTISRDDVERARLMSEYKYELDTQSRVAFAWQQGEEQGRKDGELQGRKDGEEQGRREEKLEVARNLNSLGIAIEQITSATGLSYDEITKL